MAEDPEDERMRALEARIAKVRQTYAPKRPHQEEHYSQAQVAWRMVTELVAGLGIGFGIGFGLDRLLGTTPFLMVVFILLGFAAGVKTMMRTAGEVQRKQREERAAKDAAPGGGGAGVGGTGGGGTAGPGGADGNGPWRGDTDGPGWGDDDDPFWGDEDGPGRGA